MRISHYIGSPVSYQDKRALSRVARGYGRSDRCPPHVHGHRPPPALSFRVTPSIPVAYMQNLPTEAISALSKNLLIAIANAQFLKV